MLIAPRLRLPLGLPSEAKLGKPSNLTMAALLMIALVFAWLFSQVDAAHLKTTQSNLTLAAVQAKATGTSEPSDGSDGPVHSPGQISLKAAGNINLASVSTENYQRTDEKHKDKAWQETHGEGSYDQQTHYNQLTAGQLDLQAGGRITADMSVRDSAAVLARSPDMAWLRQLQQDPKLAGKVDWKQIEEAHQHWDYKHQGLTPAASAVVALVVAYFTAGAGSAIVNTAAGSTTAAASGAGAVAAGMTQAAVSTMASQAAVSFINNGGDLGKTLNDLGSSQSMRQLATAVVTAGVLSGIGQVTFGEGKNAFSLDKVKVGDGFMKNMGKNLIDGVARATVNSAITGTDLQTNIRTNVVAGILGAAEQQGANWIGNQTLLGGDFNTNGNVNEFAHEFAHAIVGCAAGAAGASASGSGASTGQGCSAGALGAVVGELSAQFYGGTDPNQTIAFAQMMGGIAAAAAGLGAEGVSIAANTGANAAQNNYLNHAQIEALGSAWAQCKTLECKQQLIKQYKALSNENDKALESCTSFNCVAGHLAAIRQADSALASAYQLDPTGQLGQTINGWQYHSQAVIAPFTANQQHLITSRKDTLVLYMNQFCRGVSANACATQMLQNEATSKAIGELAYMAAMFTPLGVVDDTKTLATGQNLTGEDSSRLLAVLGVLTAGESSALGKAVEKAGGLVKAAKAAVSDSPEALKLAKELEDVNKAGVLDTNRTQLIDDLVASGTKITPENVVDIQKIPDGRTVWLETGNNSAGLQHINRHADEFAQQGISQDQIPDAVFSALQQNNIVGYQGVGMGRPIYKYTFEGTTHRMAITVGDNGFIVGANPASLP